MAKVIETTGKTVDEALSAALEVLGVAAEDVSYEILETPSKGFFGFGAKPAKIQVTLNDNAKESQSEIPKPEPVPVVENPAENKSETLQEKFEIETSPENNSVENNSEEKNTVEGDSAEKNSSENTFDKLKTIEKAKNFLLEIFSAMKIEVEINAAENESEVTLNLVGKDLGVLIGKHGQTLDALQYLTNLASNSHDVEEKVYFVLDVENYRHRRAVALKKLAKSVAERVIRTHKEVKLDPMSRSERKVVHTVLQANSKVETHSAGEDPYRYVIVSPKKKS